ncbi:MAG: hypothetical protein ACSLE0_23330 [Chitinophagaceae bacterium]
MKLFSLDNKWNLLVSEEAWGLVPFKKILERDDNKEKEMAIKEMLFIYYFCDIRSNYLHMDEKTREEEIRHDIGLPEDWKVDDIISEAIDFYNLRSKSVIQQLYEDTLMSAQAIGTYLRNTEALLQERDSYGKTVTDITKLTNANEKVPKLMANLKAAYKEVIKEKEDNENKVKGARSFNTFEDGLKI